MKSISKDHKFVFFIIGLAFIFFVFILPKLEKNYNKDMKSDKENMASLNAQYNSMLFDKKKCSRKCCIFNDYPAPFQDNVNNCNRKNNKSLYIGNNFMCNRGKGQGCLCLTKKDLSYLASRGGNSPNCN